MRGWVMSFKDGDVIDLAEVRSGRSDSSKVSLLGDTPVRDSSREKVSRSGLDIVFSDSAGQHAIIRHSVRDGEAQDGLESTSGLDVEGSVDKITERFASGWVWRRSTPDQALEVEALLNGAVIGRTLADQMLPNHGAGRHG